jgi:aminopeptidase
LNTPLDFKTRLSAFAGVVVRIGLNLQAGQRLLIAEPYELHGVARSAETIVEAIKVEAFNAANTSPGMIEVIWGDPERLRALVGRKNWRGLAQLAATNAHKISDYVRRGDAVLFPLGSQPDLMKDIPSDQAAEARRIGSEYFGPVAQALAHAATNWTAVPAPSAGWADSVYGELKPPLRLPALWDTVLEAMRVPREESCDAQGNAVAASEAALVAWDGHLRALQKKRDDLNARRIISVSYQGEGTDLTLSLPPEHVWCTAAMRTKTGIPFLANLPTEEVFTLPDKNSANGNVRVARPVVVGGTVIDGIELEFKNGRVTRATARSGENFLHRLLETDEGAQRLGEVAIVIPNTTPTFPASKNPAVPETNLRSFRHVLLDENACHHIALGEGYEFCLKSPNADAMNRSLLHLDLPIAGSAIFKSH